MDAAELDSIMQGRTMFATNHVPRKVTPGKLKADWSRTTDETYLFLSLWIGIRKGIDQQIILPIFLGLFGIYLVAYDSYPLTEAQSEGTISRYQNICHTLCCLQAAWIDRMLSRPILSTKETGAAVSMLLHHIGRVEDSKKGREMV